MDKPINHWCKICGKGYYACNDCDSKHYITWRAVACTPEHYQAYMILHEYDGTDESKELSKAALEPLIDATQINTYTETAQRLMNEIFENKPVIETKQKQKRKKTVPKKE